ncbi:hypothetical protein RhiirA4_526293 [Rhizophagus irregularis]|uniref:Uncharacterized protein n=1 Tax=Rhizophagus irregularis TaxID=588596 RepID=A0A2I1GQL3_9GLOM|nr:hypothetical protein RhiirA4_526293 [Rhizophagus irregularis]
MSSEYKNIEYRYRFLKETAKYFNSGSRNAIHRQERGKKENSLSRTEQNFLESIRKDSVHRKETIQDIVLKCSDTSFEIYRDEIKRLAWENSKLREELRQTSHVRDKNSKEGKQKERIISQKDEQIRKISQELKDMSSELNKVKAGNHKKDDQPKKGKKSRRSSNKKIREKIFEIPVLPEISKDDPLIEEARDIFFYDIPKYWSEEDVRTNLMKIGKVLRIQVRGQHKYKTVKAKLVLNENFEITFKEGHFGICISKHFIRWYDAQLDLKGRQERDKWQSVRDLTNEEMESIKNGSSYDFIKKLQQNTKSQFLKIIKITKNWKVIGYFKDQKALEEAVEDSCTRGNINEVWMIRNKKTIYRKEDKEGGTKKSASTKETNVKENLKSARLPPPNLTETKTTPMTPPDRIYSELGNFASKNYDFFGKFQSQKDAKIPDFSMKSQNPEKTRKKTPNEDEVVDLVKKWRLNDNTPDIPSPNNGKKDPGTLKKDNVAPEEVVEIICNHRLELHEKAKSCAKLKDNSSPVEITTKVKEWQKIYTETGNEMQWEAISLVALEEKQEAENLEGQEEVSKWLTKQENMLSLRKRVIELAEQQNDLDSGEYWTLNDNFTKRLEDVNRYQDEKETGNKRPILESPPAPARKPILVEANENSDDGSEEMEEKEEDSGPNVKLEGESSTKAPVVLSKTQMKKKKKRENRKKK